MITGSYRYHSLIRLLPVAGIVGDSLDAYLVHLLLLTSQLVNTLSQ